MKNRSNFIKALLFSTMLAVMFVSCNKDFTSIGKEFIPAEDLLKLDYRDTTNIAAYTISDDSLYTYNMPLAILGSVYDPVFGRTDASFFSAAQYISSDKAKFYNNVKIDSAYVQLSYDSIFFKTTNPVKLKVYEISENIKDSLSHTSNKKLNYYANPIGEKVFIPNSKDSVMVDGKKVKSMLRIPLNDIFKNKFATLDTTTLYKNDKFKAFFKGICIIAETETTSGKGTIISFATANESGIKIYYQNKTDDSLKLLLPFSERFNHYNHYNHAEAESNLKQQLAGNKELGKDKLYIQGMAGTKVKLFFPDFKTALAGKNIQIVDAQLVITNAAPDPLFIQPNALSLYSVGVKGTSNPSPIDDGLSSDKTYFDGTYNKNTKTYRFRINYYIQQLISGKIDPKNGLYLTLPNNVVPFSPHRLIINGNNTKGIKLYIRYTEIK